MKKKVLIPVYYFYPAVKAGGPVESLFELVKCLQCVYDITVVTTNRDIDGSKLNININNELNVNIIYNKDLSFKLFFKILNSKRFDFVYINSLFSFKECFYFLFLSFFFNYKIVISIRGQLMENAIRIKKIKKLIYLKVLKFIFLSKIHKVHLTHSLEQEGVDKYLPVNINKILTIQNLKAVNLNNFNFNKKKQANLLRIIFYSRIVPKKNLKFALEILSHYKNYNIIFDIYGPIEDEQYWESISEYISDKSLNVRYRGFLKKDQINFTFSNYDLFFLPTLAENFGHVIIESLMNGVPVLLSDNTPFLNSNLMGAGWAFPLNQKQNFYDVIDKLYFYDDIEYSILLNNIYAYLFDFNLNNSASQVSYSNFMFNE